MKGKRLDKILEVVGDEYDAIQALAEDGVGMDAKISAAKLQKLSVDELKGMVDEVMKKQSVPKGKKVGRRRRVKQTKQEAANLRLYGLLSSKELMVGLAKSLQRGEAIVWPVTITLDDGTEISFLTVATMVRQQITRFFTISYCSPRLIGFLFSSLCREELSIRRLGKLNSADKCALDRAIITMAARLITSTPSFLMDPP
jgi:hypothetical protein